MSLAHDPLRAVYDALERAGCQPYGPQHKFTARCPAHDDRNASLSVGAGADGRALIWCHAGCPTEDVVDAVGGSRGPTCSRPGTASARPLRGIGRAKPALELVLAALAEIHVPYCATRDPGIWVAEVCPVCLRSDRWPLFIVEDDCRRITLSCAGGCDQIDVLYRIVGAEEVAA